MSDYKEFTNFAHSLADKARQVMTESLSGPISIETKEDKSPVTIVDQNIEQALREMINARYPGHGILGEEYESENLEAEYVWVIDPIDGTKAFITGVPVYGTLVSLTHNGYPVVGIIDHPVTNERWVGQEGEDSTYNGRTIFCRDCPSLADAIVSVSNPETLSADAGPAWEELMQKTKWRIYGGSCYAYGRMAMGRIDVSIDSGLDPFDYCALDVIIRGADGIITDWQGERLSIRSGNRLLAAGSAERHAEILEILKNCQR